jgi:flagellar export protein FliJ
MPVPFRFDTVLRVREAERDRCRLALAQEQEREVAFTAECERIRAEYQSAVDELNLAQSDGRLSADQLLARRTFVEQLSREITRIGDALRDVGENIALRRKELLESDAAVKALEKLAGRHVSNQHQAEQSRLERDRDDTWRGGRVA